MFDRAGFLTLLDEMEEKRRISSVPILRQQSEIGLVGLKSRQKPGPKPRGGKPLSSGKPQTGGKPFTGRPPVGARDDEWRKRRGGPGGGGAGGAGGAPGPTLAPSTKNKNARPYSSPASSGAGPAFGITPAAKAARLAIASGSQPAVVKLVSFAAGGSRIGALLTYQSRGGEVPAEDEAGFTHQGNAWVQEIADQWSAEDGRQPSKDVMRLSIALPADTFPSEVTVSASLKQALPGHRMAWRISEAGEIAEDGRRFVDVVVSTAHRSVGHEKAGRIYDNRKSRDGLERSLKTAFGEDAHVDVQGFAHGVEGVARYLGQIRKGGRHDLRAARLESDGCFAGDVVLSGPKAAIEEARAWKRDLRSQERRDVAHIVLSAKPGTPKEAFVSASRAMLAREFAGHQYVFALHEDRDHLHVHAVVKMRAETGERMHPGIRDFKRWRETLAEEARQRDIPMDAVSRFERANPPGYKMKDIRRVERGEASETIRRRVAAVRDGEIHVPTREEGRRRAEATVRAWSDMSRTAFSSDLPLEPLQRPGMVRLYRAERSGPRSSSAPLFTLDRASAAQVVVRDGGSLRFLDIPSTEIHQLIPSRKHPGTVFVVPRDIASRAEFISPILPAEIIRFTEHAALAAGIEKQNPEITFAWNQKDNDMADLRLMKSSFKDMDESLEAIASNLPKQKAEEFKALRDKVKTNQRVMLEAQEEIEKKRGKIEGETFVKPQPVELQNFVAEERGETMRYSHRKSEGRVGAVAFTDHGDKVEISNWNDREIVLAAMQVASTKWGSLTITGTDRYKALAIELAAEHGFKITNPELQSALNAARDHIALRPDKAGIAAGVSDERLVDVQPAPRIASETPKPLENASPLKPIDDGLKIRPAEREREAMLAAMRQAEAKWGAIAVNGTASDKALAVELAAEHGLTLTNPELQDKLAEARLKVEERRQKQAERESKRLGFVEGAADQPELRRTEAEIEIGLAAVRERTETEASREVRQATRSSATNERPFDGGGEDHAYRTSSEAAAAVRAERSVEQSVDKPMAADINQSQEIAQQRHAQEELLAERQANKDVEVKKQAERQKPKQRQ
ncbi:LPD7 domain-containing protein [Rhizobium sp. C4]|uniref:LPD7 domain-containing protein n=1 Tax=Rhizobium sp. C4 TaxID=1349800 RepID=UPI001E57A8A1|nr:LPD7 domain-containing protein [Rhizobium sp. C4]MCD2174924.1 relaxase/mobilization nuclease domain-containing protein [Rhizobium sp. C4]